MGQGKPLVTPNFIGQILGWESPGLGNTHLQQNQDWMHSNSFPKQFSLRFKWKIVIFGDHSLVDEEMRRWWWIGWIGDGDVKLHKQQQTDLDIHSFALPCLALPYGPVWQTWRFPTYITYSLLPSPTSEWLVPHFLLQVINIKFGFDGFQTNLFQKYPIK